MVSQGTTRRIPEEIPSNVYKLASPLTATILENRDLIPESQNDVRHLVFSLEKGNYPFLDGQSAGILPPGTDEQGKPHKLRLYSIASPSWGEDGEGKTLALCVKRLIYTDEHGVEKRGVCSNYLNDLKPGDQVQMTGPVGKGFLMPDEQANLIMMATGTGIAPFRGFLQTRYKLYQEDPTKSWLFFGAQTRKDFLYAEELEGYQQHDSYRLFTSFSREEKNDEGGRLYIQHKLYQHRHEVFELLQKPNTYVYMCGLKGMETGIIEAFEKAAHDQGIDWLTFFQQLKDEKRWRIEVY